MYDGVSACTRVGSEGSAETDAVVYRALGHLEVICAAGVIPLNAAKHRIILAGLLLTPRRVVSVDVLVRRLWGDAPPPSARNALQVYVTRLRAAIGPGHGIVSRPQGYLVDPAHCRIDVEEFHEHRLRGQAELTAGRRDGALEAFRVACGLWRGPLLSDVPSEALQREEGAALTEVYLKLQEQRVDLELSAGRHRDVIPDLKGMVAANPLRERLGAQLMLALHGAGMQADALAVYHETAAMLRDELGVDPGRELRAAHGAVLRDTVGERPAAGPRRAGVTRTPRQLPPAIGDFTGRARQVDALTTALTPPERSPVAPIVVLSGAPGVGKTTLAVQVAQLLQDRFPDGQLFVRLETGADESRSAADVLSELLIALGVPRIEVPAGMSARSAAFRSLLAGRRFLLLLDGASDVDQVEHVLPGTSTSAVLITARCGLPGLAGAVTHRVHPFSRSEGVELLKRVADEVRVHRELAVAEHIVDLCGGLPLALRAVGSRLRQQPALWLSSIADRIRDESRRLDELAVNSLDVRVRLECCYAALDPASRTAYRNLAQLGPAAFPACALGGDGERLAENLMARGLLEPAGEGGDRPGGHRYRSPELVRVHALSKSGEDAGDVVEARRALSAAAELWKTG